MTNLDTLLKIAREATQGKRFTREDHDYYQGGTYIGVGPIRYLRKNEPNFTIPVPEIDCDGKEAEYFKQDICKVECNNDVDFLLTFNPSLIEKMLDEIKSARRMADNIGLSNTRYDQAREALDKELESV